MRDRRVARCAGPGRAPRFRWPIDGDRLPIVACSRPTTRGRHETSLLLELVSASAGVTYWASDAKSRRELGYAPRDLEAGLTATFG